MLVQRIGRHGRQSIDASPYLMSQMTKCVQDFDGFFVHGATRAPICTAKLREVDSFLCAGAVNEDTMQESDAGQRD